MSQPTKRQANKAIKDAIADRKIPDDTKYTGYRYGEGFTAEYGLYWQHRGITATFHQRADRTWYLGYTIDIDRTSHMATTLVAWSPM
jgi:hypothetical protein